MELIIKLPPWVYESVKNGTFDAKRSPYDLESVLKYGYPLPSKHGRLIDADELRTRMYHEAFETDTDYQRWDSGCWIRYKMFEQIEETALTIVPADKEAEKQVTGRWIRKMDAYRGGYVECSVCGTPYKYIDPKKMKTCMICHARMEESE